MPVTVTPTNLNLSRTWTYEMIASEARVLTNTTDNEDVQLSNVRNHINVAISTIAEELNMASQPWYGVALPATIEATPHPSGLNWVNLDTAATDLNTWVPSLNLWDIYRVSSMEIPNSVLTNTWKGNFTKRDISQLTHLNNRNNTQWTESIAWNHHGNALLVYVGADIGVLGDEDKAYILDSDSIVIWGYRQPNLDDLLPPALPGVVPVTGQSTTYRTNIDLPDRYVRLLITMVQKMILEQINKIVPQYIEQTISQSMAEIQRRLGDELQLEKARREKLEYGDPQPNGKG